MTNAARMHPAEERLLEAALTQHFAGARARITSSPAPRWLVAALVLLGLGVVATTMWQVRQGRVDETQEPAPLPPEVTGDGKTKIGALPVTTGNLLAKIVDPRDLPVVERFPELRGLRLWAEKVHIAGINTGEHHPRWSNPPADLLQPVARLRQLEVLKLPRNLAVTPALLAPLAGHPSLRELQFVGDGVVIDDAFVAALAAIPQLRALHLMFVGCDGEALRRLAKLPIESLELEWCTGLDAAGWQAILSMRALRRLAFKDWAWNVDAKKDGAGPWRPAATDLRRLQELPRLRTLELTSCKLDDAQFAALPDTLHSLAVLGHELSPAGISELQRFVKLRRLDLALGRDRTHLFVESQSPAEKAEMADAVAAALGALRLDELRCVGEVSPALATAIGSQKELTRLTFSSLRAPDLAGLAALPKLERLMVYESGSPGNLTLDTLRPLRECAALRALELSAYEIDAAAVKALFGEQVRVTATSWKPVPKK